MSQQQVLKYLLGGGALGISASVVFGGNALFPSTVDALGDASGPTQTTSATYDGTVEADGYWGYVQVRIQVENNELTDIKLLQHPDSDRTTYQINSIALPRLIKSALQSQSADISNVSGATYSSMAFKNSLQAALMEAGL